VAGRVNTAEAIDIHVGYNQNPRENPQIKSVLRMSCVFTEDFKNIPAGAAYKFVFYMVGEMFSVDKNEN
jgi:hypothetical protein